MKPNIEDVEVDDKEHEEVEEDKVDPTIRSLITTVSSDCHNFPRKVFLEGKHLHKLETL